MARFFQGREVQPISQFAPIDTGALQYNLVKRQQEFDNDLADIGNVMQDFNLEATPAQMPRLSEIMQGYNEEVNSLVDSYMKTGDKRVPYELRRLRDRLNNDPEIRNIKYSKQQFDFGQPEVQKRMAEGDYDPSLLDKSYRGFVDSSMGLDENGKAKAVTFGGVEAALDIMPDVRLAFKDIMPDQTAWAESNYADGKLSILTKDGTRKFISRDDIEAVALKNVNNLKQSNAGKQLIRKLANDGITDQESINRAIYDLLVNEGEKYIFSQVDAHAKRTETALGKTIGKGKGKDKIQIDMGWGDATELINVADLVTKGDVESKSLNSQYNYGLKGAKITANPKRAYDRVAGRWVEFVGNVDLNTISVGDYYEPAVGLEGRYLSAKLDPEDMGDKTIYVKEQALDKNKNPMKDTEGKPIFKADRTKYDLTQEGQDLFVDLDAVKENLTTNVIGFKDNEEAIIKAKEEAGYVTPSKPKTKQFGDGFVNDAAGLY